MIGIDTLSSISKLDTLTNVVFFDLVEYPDVKTIDTFVVKTNSYLQLRVRLEIVNYLNDNRPIVIHQVTIRDTFETNFKFIYQCGLSWDPTYESKKEAPFPGLIEIPSITPIHYEEKGNQSNSSFISDSKYLEIQSNRSFIVDFVFWTKNKQIKLVCKKQQCSICKEVQATDFKKIYSAIEIMVDKPDYDDNTKVNYNCKDVINLY